MHAIHPRRRGKGLPTTEDFVLRAQAIHGKSYEYNNATYTTAKSKVSVTCPLHGDFSILPFNHLAGSGCPTCNRERQAVLMADGARHSQEEMIAKFHETHERAYDYSHVRYVRGVEPVNIICPKHGLFMQAPFHHLAGKGCPRCANQARGDANRLLQADVIERFRTLHGKRFDYSKFRYIDFKTKSLVGCREPGHGFFEMNAQAHLEGKGCPACSQSLGERIIDEWLRESGYEYIREFPIPSVSTEHRRLRFDFFLPRQRMLIEFDGEQHFRPVRFFGSTEKTAQKLFKEIKRRDSIKDAWAAENDYKLVRISYDEDIVGILTSLDAVLLDALNRHRGKGSQKSRWSTSMYTPELILDGFETYQVDTASRRAKWGFLGRTKQVVRWVKTL